MRPDHNAPADLSETLVSETSSRTPGRFRTRRHAVLLGAGLAASLLAPSLACAQTELLNVSYDPTRELYREINAAFSEEWKTKTGETLTVRAANREAHLVAGVREAENSPLLRHSGADEVVVSSEAAGRLMGVASASPPTGSVLSPWTL